MSETSLERILEEVESLKPSALVVDSVQTIYSSRLPSGPGSISQVREIATQLLFVSKGRGVTSFLIGHVTKDGSLAGRSRSSTSWTRSSTSRASAPAPPHRPRRQEPLRRHLGAGCVRDDRRRPRAGAEPVSLFLSERQEGAPGSAVVATIEGSRPMLVEVQALVSPTSFGTPRRMSLGIDPNRTSLLLAVLEKRVGLELLGDDVYVSVAGGLEVDEPGADLGVAAAVASSCATGRCAAHRFLRRSVSRRGSLDGARGSAHQGGGADGLHARHPPVAQRPCRSGRH